MKDLGCANSWSPVIVYPSYKDMVHKTNEVIQKPDTTPLEYTACQQAFKTGGANHPLTVVKKGNCWYQYTCPICGITWDVDSSD